MVIHSSVEQNAIQKCMLLFRGYLFLRDLKLEYPHFWQWYIRKVVVGVLKNNRRVLYLAKEKELLAIAILKDTAEEKKICTLRVAKGYRKKGLGTALLLESMQSLNCKSPLITVSELRIEEYKHFLCKNGFHLVEICHDYYSDGLAEYCFNGSLVQVESCNAYKLRLAADLPCDSLSSFGFFSTSVR